MVVEDHRLVLSEHRLEALVTERVRVRAEWPEDHQVCYIHHADAQSGDELAEERGGGDDLEGDFYTDADEDDVGVDTFVRGAELPDRRAGDTMLE